MGWFKRILVFLRLAAKEVEEGNIGAGKKTAKGGEIAGKVVDAVDKATDPEPEQ